MKNIQSELPIFYETAHAELASALEMLAACKETDTPNQALGYFMHAKDEYSHAKCFFKMLSQRGKEVSLEKAREFRFTPQGLITKGYISRMGFLIDRMKIKDFIAFFIISPASFAKGSIFLPGISPATYPISASLQA